MSKKDAFLQAIRENPDDNDLRLVFADWLEEQGDPRADLIRIQCRMERAAPGDTAQSLALEAQAESLIEDHPQWLGDKPDEFLIRFERGMVWPSVDRFAVNYKGKLEPWWNAHRPWITKVSLGVIQDYDLEFLLSHSVLADLCWAEIGISDVTSHGFESLPQQSHLRILTLEDLSDIDDDIFQYISQLPKLQRLHILSCSTTLNGISLLEDHGHLRTLHLSEGPGGSLEPLGHLPQLEELTLKWLDLDEPDYGHLLPLTGLKHLALATGDIDEEDIESMTKISSLRSLAIEADLEHEAFEKIEQLTQLQSLQLRISDCMPENGIQKLLPLQLRRLSFAGTVIEWAGVNHLAGMETLEVLDLSDSRLSNNHCKALSTLSNLQVLSLAHNPITSKGLKCLTDLPKLESLTLTGTKINDKALTHIELLPSLKWLDLSDTKVTKKGMKALQKKCSNLTVIC